MKQKSRILGIVGALILFCGIISIQASATSGIIWFRAIVDNQIITPLYSGRTSPESPLSIPVVTSMQGMVDSVRDRLQQVALIVPGSQTLPEPCHLAGVRGFATQDEYDTWFYRLRYDYALAHEADFRRVANQYQQEEHFADGFDDILWTQLQISAEGREPSAREQQMFDDYMVRNRETSSYYFFVVPTVMERVLGILADEPAAAAAIDQAWIRTYLTESSTFDAAMTPQPNGYYALLLHTGDSTSCHLCHPQTEADYARVEAPYVGLYSYEVYRAANPDLQAAFGEDRMAYLNHWLTSGRAEGRIAH